jgi:Transposase DDE domain
LPVGFELGEPALEKRRKHLVSLVGVCRQRLSKLGHAGHTVAEPSARPTGGQRAESQIEAEAMRSADLEEGWLVKQKKITPHIPVFDKSNRTDGTFSRADFAFDAEHDRYTCPAGKEPVQFRRTYAIPRSGVTAEGTRLYRVSELDCDTCKLKPQCCPNAVARKIPRVLHEDARDMARAHAATPEYVEACRRRKKVEMLFAHLKRILRLTRLRLRDPNGANDEFLLAATAQNLRRLARLRPMNMLRECWPHNALHGRLKPFQPFAKTASFPSDRILDSFFNEIGA